MAKGLRFKQTGRERKGKRGGGPFYRHERRVQTVRVLFLSFDLVGRMALSVRGRGRFFILVNPGGCSGKEQNRPGDTE